MIIAHISNGFQSLDSGIIFKMSKLLIPPVCRAGLSTYPTRMGYQCFVSCPVQTVWSFADITACHLFICCVHTAFACFQKVLMKWIQTWHKSTITDSWSENGNKHRLNCEGPYSWVIEAGPARLFGLFWFHLLCVSNEVISAATQSQLRHFHYVYCTEIPAPKPNSWCSATTAKNQCSLWFLFTIQKYLLITKRNSVCQTVLEVGLYSLCYFTLSVGFRVLIKFVVAKVYFVRNRENS